jgi:hypothetical protein
MIFNPDNDGMMVVRLKETFSFSRERQASDVIAGAVNGFTIAQINTKS